MEMEYVKIRALGSTKKGGEILIQLFLFYRAYITQIDQRYGKFFTTDQ
jgi:hypothetical protein